MKKPQAWQDMVTLLSGTNPSRSTRPGEWFTSLDDDLDEQPAQPFMVVRLVHRLRVWLRRLQAKRSTPFVSLADQPEYRYRKG